MLANALSFSEVKESSPTQHSTIDFSKPELWQSFFFTVELVAGLVLLDEKSVNNSLFDAECVAVAGGSYWLLLQNHSSSQDYCW